MWSDLRVTPIILHLYMMNTCLARRSRGKQKLMFNFKRTRLYSEAIAQRVGQTGVGGFIQRVKISLVLAVKSCTVTAR